MYPQQNTIVHSLFELYETLPGEVQKSFLEELMQKKPSAITALTSSASDGFEKRNAVILGVMEDAFAIPDNFDEPLPENLINEFYTDNL